MAGDPAKVDEATRRHYTKLHTQPGAMRAAFAQFRSIAAKDVADNIVLSKNKLPMPVLAIGGEKSFGANMAIVMRNAASNVQQEVVPNAGHWLIERKYRDDRRAIAIVEAGLLPAVRRGVNPDICVACRLRIL